MQINNAPYTGWGRVLSGTGGRARPEKSAALARFAETSAGPAIGALRAYGDAALSSARPAVDMSRMDRLIAFDPETGVLEAEAGVSLANLLHLFAPRGWMPAVVPGTGYASLGGAIAADVHGKSHHEVGTFGQHVKAIRLLGPDGSRSEATPDSDLFRATCGGMGLTGIIESAVLPPLPSQPKPGPCRSPRHRFSFLPRWCAASTRCTCAGCPFTGANARGPSLGSFTRLMR